MDLKDQADTLQENGFIIIEGILTSDECDTYKSMLERDYLHHKEKYVSSNTKMHGLNNKISEKTVYNMHNKDIKYFDLFDHDKTLPLINHVLKQGSYENSEPVNLLNISARCPLKGSLKQQLHLDSNLPGKGGYPLILVALFMLDDFNEKNGSTNIVPKSHHRDYYAETGKSYDDEITVNAKRGSVLIFNGALWHGASEKLTGHSRWAIILGYGRWFIKPSFDFARNTPDFIFNQLSDERKRLIGLDTAPPLDEFTRVTRRSGQVEYTPGYNIG